MDPGHASASGPKRPHGSQTSHREVADELRRRIRSGVLRPGQRMPTQAELGDEFGVERGAVRQALRILQAEHLLTDVSRGSPATVAAGPDRFPAGPAALPLPTLAALPPRIAAAFATAHVEIDALCLTSVSLTLAIGEPLRRIHAGRLKPAKIDVRVLLPGRGVDLAFPVPAGASAPADAPVPADSSAPADSPIPEDSPAPADPSPADSPAAALHRRWLTQRNAQGQVLRHGLLALRASHGIDVRVTFRALPFTPPVKLYLLNGSEALFAYYTVRRREREVDHEPLQTYDVEGTRSMLFSFERGAGPHDAAFVGQSRGWFDALWETISSELVLTG
ncbi:GntR family transcriptional regulator [Streptomyces sp. NPDC015220]|uniref:winged helix-turn-helix domain-containing protein n=1 Tax=Streptomyces sp. NPDC015220 TaxID=3364947 RepID=UPI0036FB9B4B